MRYGYIRVSSEEQNLARQEEIMKQQNVDVRNVFAEKVSGKNLERKKLQELLERVRPGDSIVVADVSRLGRNMRDIVNVVCDLDQEGITIKSIKEGVDTGTETGRMFVMLSGIFAEMERSAIKERQKQGIAIAKANGKMTGRPKKECAQFETIYRQYRNEQIQLEQAAKLLECSKSTFYRRVRVYEERKEREKREERRRKVDEDRIDF